MEEYGYYTSLIKETEQIIDKYSNVSVTSLCKSILGRDIPILTLGEGQTRIVYFGGELGSDKISPYVLIRFIKDICALYAEGGAVFGFSAEYILKKYMLIIIPMLNPDGAIYCDCGVSDKNPLRERVIKMNGNIEDFSNWQGNARGVDLKYNYHFDTESLEESEVEVGRLCNYLRFGTLPAMIFALSQGAKGESTIYYGEDGISNKISIALSQMTKYKRSSPEGEKFEKGILYWSNKNLPAKAFRIELGYDVSASAKKATEINFLKYLELRKMLFCAPLLSKI